MTKKKLAAATSLKIADNVYLNTIPVAGKKDAKAAAPPPTHHIAVVDCSGSMAGDLPLLREQLKKKLPKLLAERDTFSCIWFSGKDQAGILLEAEPVARASDLQTVHKVIDRWLQPVGLTGFVKPLQLAKELVERVSATRKGVFSLFFMSDGQDNQWGREEILSAVREAGGVVQAATFVEYGYYADRAMLASMTEAASGKHIFAESFDDFVAAFEKSLGDRPPDAPRIEIGLEVTPIHGVAFSLDAKGEITTYGAERGWAKVYEDAGEIYSLSNKPAGELRDKRSDFAAHYAALAVYAARMNSDVIFAILRDLADVEFIDDFANCFGKQAYSAFIEKASKAAADASLRFRKGRDPNRLPREDAFTILDLLALLQQDGARLLLDSKDFRYNLIGRRRIDADTSEDALVFERSPNPDGYEIRDLTFNQERPNVSVLVRREGHVDLTKKLHEAPPAKTAIPARLPTHQFKNYALVRDGLVNVRFLPARIGVRTLDALKTLYEEGRLKYGAIADGIDKAREAGDLVDVVFDLSAIPLMARKSVKETSAADFFAACHALIKQKARQKVLNSLIKDQAQTPKNQGYGFLYGADVAAWLKSIGIDDLQGYAPPHTTSADKTGDFYMSKVLAGSIKGLGTASKPSLPKLEDVRAGKGGAGGKMMRPILEEIEANLRHIEGLGSADPGALLSSYLTTERRAARATTRANMLALSKTVFSIIVGQVWFKEFSSLDEREMKLTFDDVEYLCTAKLEQEKIEL